VSGWVSALLGRQIDDRDRQRLFIAAAAVVIAVALLLVAVRPDQARNHASARRVTASAPIKPPGTVTRPAVEQPATPASVTRSASAFLAGYLPYLYGQSRARLLPAASVALQRELAHQALVVPPAQSRLHPRVLSVTATRGRGGDWTVRALIADGGVADYPIILTLERDRGRWSVSGVSG
jgi:hypothetical protein